MASTCTYQRRAFEGACAGQERIEHTGLSKAARVKTVGEMAAPYSTSAAAAGGAPAGGLHLPTGTATVNRRDIEDLVRRVRSNGLYNRQLSTVCQVNGLKSTGVKADLQRRITDCKFASSSPSPHPSLAMAPSIHHELRILISRWFRMRPPTADFAAYPFFTDILEAFHNQDANRFQQIRQSVDNVMNKRSTPVKQPPGRTQPQPQQQSPFMPAFGESSSSNGPFGQGFKGQSRDGGNGSSSMGGSPGLTFHTSPFYTIQQQIGKTLSCPGRSDTCCISSTISDGFQR